MNDRAACGPAPVGSRVEYLGEDLPDLYVWQGHPGVVIDAPPFEPQEVAVALVAGPSLCFPASDVRRLDDANYHSRGERIIAGRHPIAERDVGAPLTAEGSHCP